jgi:hypothetical protein
VLITVALVGSVADQSKAPLTLTQLQQFAFDLGASASVEGGRVPLAGGTWTDPADGGSTFSLLPVHAIGDLDGDGAVDAAAILQEVSPGTGRFVYLFALMNRDGEPRQMGPPEWLGDRSVVERLSIDRKGLVSVRFLTHQDGDPDCCPTLRIEDRFRVVKGQLVGITK